MHETPEDAWFYTREGERIGPVSFAELQVRAGQGEVNPRLDLVWTQGMDTWQAAGEIEGLFERRPPPPMPQESLAPAADPYTPPKLESVEDMMSRIVDWPGARRRGFLMATILFPLVWHGIVILSTGFLVTQFGPRIMGVLGIGLALLPVLVGIYFGLMRLVNLGMSRWWYLANLVPFLNVWIGYRCFACPAGYAFHKKLDGVGVVLAIVYWLVVVAVIVAVAGVGALMFGALGSPDQQDQLRDLIRDLIRAAQEQAAKP